MAHASRLVLFDIDGTLIHSGRAGVRGMNAAFARVHGRDQALDGVTLAGRTDRAIVSDVLRALGLDPTPEAIDDLRDAYLHHLAEELGRPGHGGGVLPGVTSALDALVPRADTHVGLLTGNFARGAELKLGHFGLWHRFAFGAYGDAHVNRRDLVPIAIEAAARHAGVRVPPARVMVIGDTPADVDCALAHGAVAVGVATGPFTREDLAAAGAALALDTLEDAALIEAVERLG